ncbi:MAG: hypothetical protein Q9204_000092, partial [Flavoplaca sp. TL-2023a]
QTISIYLSTAAAAMYAFKPSHLSIAILFFLFVCCHSVPAPINDATRTHWSTARNPQDPIKREHRRATALLPRTSISLNRYKLITLRLTAFIATPPLSLAPAIVAHLQQYRGPQLYATLRDHVRQMWPTMVDQQALELAIGPFMFHIQTEKGQTIPLDFVERFCETMEMWATNGFTSLYLALVEDSGTTQRIAVALSLLGPAF